MGLKPCTITKLELLKVAVRKTLLSDNVHISTDIVLQCYSTRAKILQPTQLGRVGHAL